MVNFKYQYQKCIHFVYISRFICLFGPLILVQLWVGPCCGVQPQAQGVAMFVTTLLHLKVLYVPTDGMGRDLDRYQAR